MKLLAMKNNKIRFAFVKSSIGRSITSNSNSPNIKHAREYFQNVVMHPLKLNKILKMAGAIIVTEEPMPDKKGNTIDYTDLSPTALDKTTFIEMFSNGV